MLGRTSMYRLMLPHALSLMAPSSKTMAMLLAALSTSSSPSEPGPGPASTAYCEQLVSQSTEAALSARS